MRDETFVDALATAIYEMNKDKQSYCLQVIKGEHKGKYVSYHRNLVKHKRSAFGMVTDKPEDWKKWYFDYPIPFDHLQIVLKKKGKKGAVK